MEQPRNSISQEVSFKYIAFFTVCYWVLHAFWLKGGGHFEVKEGHPDFLQIT